MATHRGIPTDALHEAKIIIIDDEPETVRILTAILRAQGFADIQGVTDPRTAIELLKSRDPDLVILDLHMPHVSGLEVLKQIREQSSVESYLPVLVMTGDSRVETKRQALAGGATDFLNKPFDHIELVQRTTNLLEVHLLHRALNAEKQQLEIAVCERTTELKAEIVERRRIEDSLREAEAKYRTMLEDAVFGVFQVDPEGKILMVNAALARLGGYDSPEELRTSVTDVFTQLCADSELLQQFIQLIYKQGSVTGFEGPMYRKDGALVWVSVSARVVRDNTDQVQYFEGTLEDITERKQAEKTRASAIRELDIRVQQRTAELTRTNEELRAIHRRLEAVLAKTPVILWTTDSTGVITFASGRVCRLLEQRPEKMVGRSVFDLYRANSQIIENHQRVLQGETVDATVEFNGFVLDARHVPIRNADGVIEGIIGVAVDITERRRAEAAQREQKELLQTIFDHSPVMISMWKENGRFRLANREWERVLGWSSEEARAEPDILAKVYPASEDYKQVIDFVTSTEGGWIDFKTRVRDGRQLDISWTSVHLSDGSRIGFGLDVTARKRAKLELQARLHQQAAVATFGQEALAKTGLDELFNRAVLLISQTLETEYASITELLPSHRAFLIRAGIGWREGVVGDATVSASPETLAGYTLRSNEPVIIEDLRRETRFTGPEFLHEHGAVSGMSVIIGSHTRSFGVMCTHTSSLRKFTRDDVNFLQTVANILATALERDEADKAVRSAKDEAERANRAKSEFLSRMSHELRTPLNAILGFAQLLELEEHFTGEIRDSLEQIIKGGRHLLELINEVLDISRIEAGRFSLSIEPVDTREAIAEALQLVAPLAAKHSIRLESELGANDIYLLADRQRIRQVLLNLFSNAIKYNRDSGSVRVSCGSHEPGWIRIEVRDTGNGIAQENLPKLFTPFERLGMDQRGVDGAGIGLALSKRLVELMNGRIGVESVAGDGSTFWIELPGTENPLEHAEVGGRSVVSPAPSTSRYTLLHIEDNLANLKLIERILLQRTDVRLLAAIQGELGLQLAREQRPDLILLDMHLPDINGDEVLQRLRDDDSLRDIPVILLSADATPGQIQRLLAAGATEYLTKPLDVPKFLSVLNGIIGRKHEGN